MSGRVIPMPGKPERPFPRVRVVRAGFRKDDLRWILTCPCGWNRIEHTAAEASRSKREHDAEHRGAERRHPAGKARPTGGGAA